MRERRLQLPAVAPAERAAFTDGTSTVVGVPKTGET
jgi:hypothetical protein